VLAEYRPKAALEALIRPENDLWSCYLVGPDLEAYQGVRPECMGDRNIGGIASLRDQHAADTRDVVTRIEHVPAPADIGFEPAGEVPAAHGSGVPMSLRYPVQ
jgi:hypothetical protein